MRGFMVALTGDRPRSEGFDHPSLTLTAIKPTLDHDIARHDDFYAVPPRSRSVQVGVSTARFHNDGHWNISTRTTAFSNLLATAVNCGVTRSASFMLTSPATTHLFSNLGVPDGMHKRCHDGDWQDVVDITEHQMEAFTRSSMRSARSIETAAARFSMTASCSGPRSTSPRRELRRRRQPAPDTRRLGRGTRL